MARPGARCGVVAQLGERLVRNEEVSGSIPLNSTILPFFCGGDFVVAIADRGPWGGRRLDPCKVCGVDWELGGLRFGAELGVLDEGVVLGPGAKGGGRGWVGRFFCRDGRDVTVVANGEHDKNVAAVQVVGCEDWAARTGLRKRRKRILQPSHR